MGTHGSWWPPSTSNHRLFPSLVREVTQPIMSATRLAEQGSTSKWARHRQSHTKGFNYALVQRDRLYLESVDIPVNMQLEVHQMTQRTAAKITPGTLTPTGVEALRNRNLARARGTQRKAFFCARPTGSAFSRKVGELQKQWQQWAHWRCESNTGHQATDQNPWRRAVYSFKAKGGWGASTPSRAPPMPAMPKSRMTGPTASKPAPAEVAGHPIGVRHTRKQPPLDWAGETGSTSIPHPMCVPPTSDYCIREGQVWKRVHVKLRNHLYIPYQTGDGPDIAKLTTDRADSETSRSSTMAQDRWRQDNKATSNTQPGMGRIDQLWGDNDIQRWMHDRWCRWTARVFHHHSSQQHKKG